MSKLSKAPPLKVIQAHKISQALVQTHVKDPLLPRKSNKGLQLLKQLAHLELLLEKIHRIEVWKLNDSTSNTTLKKLHHTVLHLQQDVQQNNTPNRLAETLRSGRYPRATMTLLPQSTPLLEERPSFPHQQMAYLDQLYVTACRLYHDLTLTHPDYIAYQLALLYQCINRQGVSFVSYKVRIEQRFDEIKQATRNKENVLLSPSQIAWLQHLALDIISQTVDKSSIQKCGQLGQIY